MSKHGLILLVCLALAGCGGSSSSGDPETQDGDRRLVGDTATAQESDDRSAPFDAGVIMGRWEAISQNGTMIRPGELSFTFAADGTGISLEGQSEKPFNWVHDADAGTLHILTGNEDLLLNANFNGDTLTLTQSDPPLNLVIQRAADEGGAE